MATAKKKKAAAPKKTAKGKTPAKKSAAKKTAKKDSNVMFPEPAKDKSNGVERPSSIIKPGTTTIEKIKMLKGGETVEVFMSTIESDGTRTADNRTLTRPPHKDFKDALGALRVHLGLLCGFISNKQLRDINSYNSDIIDTFKVHGVKIGVKSGNEGVMILGSKHPESGGRVGLNSPFKNFDEVPETRYRYMDHLMECLEVLKSEVVQYLDGTKVGDPPQPELPFADGGSSAENGIQEEEETLSVETHNDEPEDDEPDFDDEPVD